jgi:hypothetical protein
MRKFLIILILTVTGLSPAILSSSTANAIDILSPFCQSAINTATLRHTPIPPECQGTNDSGAGAANPVLVILTDVINLMSILIGIISVIVIIVQGLRLIVSGGDPNTVNNARTSILYACIGVVLVIFAQIFVAFVLKKFTT